MLYALPLIVVTQFCWLRLSTTGCRGATVTEASCGAAYVAPRKELNAIALSHAQKKRILTLLGLRWMEERDLEDLGVRECCNPRTGRADDYIPYQTAQVPKHFGKGLMSTEQRN
jgi:hypothetical protein